MRNFRNSVGAGFLALSLVSALIVPVSADPNDSTTKQLSTNFTLVNLAAASNSGSIQYYKSDGSKWRTDEAFGPLTTQGAQLIRRQYETSAGDPTNSNLPTAGSGSVVVSANGQMGAVVQITARGQSPTSSGAYSGASAGAASANVPLVSKNGASASGTANSQIIIQNTGAAATTASVDLVNASGSVVFTKSGISLPQGTSFSYDISNESGLANGFYSAVVKAATGGQVAVVSNFFLGGNSMQTFSGFTEGGQKWLAPLYTSRLANGLNTPVAVQNLSGNTIPAGAIKMSCVADPSSGKSNFEASNPAAVSNTASYFFNPVTDASLGGDAWFGACTVTTTGFNTVAFVQMRFVGTDNAAAYEAIRGTGTKTKVIIPLYAKRLGNGFSSAVTIANLGSQAAKVNISYKQGDGAPANCAVEKTALDIAVGGSLIQNHRLEAGVPELPSGCFGAMVVTSTNGQPIDAFVQLTNINNPAGDSFMAHDGFTAD